MKQVLSFEMWFWALIWLASVRVNAFFFMNSTKNKQKHPTCPVFSPLTISVVTSSRTGPNNSVGRGDLGRVTLTLLLLTSFVLHFLQASGEHNDLSPYSVADVCGLLKVMNAPVAQSFDQPTVMSRSRVFQHINGA